MSDKEPQQWMRETAAEILVGKGWCPICKWTLADSAEKGCVIGNCSYRPGDHRPVELRDLRVSRARWNEVAGIIAAHCPEKELGHGTPADVNELKTLWLRIDKGEIWYWQGDGYDFPESINCPVIMQAETLRELLVKSGKYPIARPSEALPDKCPTCGSPDRVQVTSVPAEICSDSWHSSVATRKESK